MNFSQLSSSEKKQIAGVAFCLAAGIGMLVFGILALINSGETLTAVSGVLGAFALITGIVTLLVRIFRFKPSEKLLFSLDWLVWLLIAFLLYNTDILYKIGKLVFVIGGIFMIIEGIRSFFAAYRQSSEMGWRTPRIIFSVIMASLGITVIINAQKIFEGLIVLAVGVYFIVQGTTVLYDAIGRIKYFRNFRGLQ